MTTGMTARDVATIRSDDNCIIARCAWVSREMDRGQAMVKAMGEVKDIFETR
jgi:hypothetical protein